ncbi:predicted protein [Pyrenophora tritici-repentis Pt-1C-BFP]|uniref:Uncharacterized protein n=1 Tax=Pyrenophora tritici-repentis (strain Pt-1C-BFP) TaxID=426418 RepID=B2WPF7_PYRTR|nr:uncharacterized protein PTRG_11867 [Pyrenophora tritici-repentis Pt-1C-BFP]EDU46023.1 predicted protein [Pyrenophora tritici-repentis Pt-1C-BFP]
MATTGLAVPVIYTNAADEVLPDSGSFLLSTSIGRTSTSLQLSFLSTTAYISSASTTFTFILLFLAPDPSSVYPL